jgi:hypothetical protein
LLGDGHANTNRRYSAIDGISLPSWLVTLTIEVEYPGRGSDVAAHLRECLYDRLVDRLVTTPRPGVYSLVLYVVADSRESAEVRASTMLDVAVNQMTDAGVKNWQVQALPARKSAP